MKTVAVVGGGPAGMMAAVKAAENHAKVILLEKMDRLGRKLMITGKGRCNLTNVADIPKIIHNIPGNGVFLNSVLRAFDNHDIIQFFTERGVATKIERGGRVFPVSDKAADIVTALETRMRELGVDIRCQTAVKELIVKKGKIDGVRLYNGVAIAADAVVLAVGGASYPGTGSSGDGAAMAALLGHTIIPLRPALVPLEVEEDWAKALTGLSLRNVEAQLFIKGTLKEQQFGRNAVHALWR